jgi:hypothetical protein
MPLTDSNDDYDPAKRHRAAVWRIWFAAGFAFLSLVLIFCVARIYVLDAWLHERTEYANARDERWEAREARRDVIFARIEKLLDRIDERAKR